MSTTKNWMDAPAHTATSNSTYGIQAQIQTFLEHGWPIISVDTKKRKLLRVSEPWARLVSETDASQQLRFSLTGARHRDFLWHLRSHAQCGLSVDRDHRGHFRICRGCHSVVVDEVGSVRLSTVACVADFGGWRGEQRLSHTFVEIHAPRTSGQFERLGSDGDPLPNRRVEMESRRSSSLQCGEL
jgi:hypothetical protein